jgi:hypothetical protein
MLSLELGFSCCPAAAMVSTGMSWGPTVEFPWGQRLLDWVSVANSALFLSNSYTVVATAIAKKHEETSNTTESHVDSSVVARRSWDRWRAEGYKTSYFSYWWIWADTCTYSFLPIRILELPKNFDQGRAHRLVGNIVHNIYVTFYINTDTNNCNNGLAMTQTVTCRLPTAAARVRSRIRACRHWGRFSPSTSVNPANPHSNKCLILIYHPGLVQ